MSKVEIKEITYGEFGKCVQLTNGDVEVVVTVDLGPRVIRYGLPGKPNVFCEAPGKVLNEKTGWCIHGGHRVWHSPENDPRCYEPDNDPIEWQKLEHGIHVISNLEPNTGLLKEMEITLDEEGTAVSVLHRITNANLWPIDFSVWCLSVMAPGGKEIVPMSQEDTGLLGNRWLGLWPYTRMNDERVWWGENFITLRQDVNCSQPFKFGITNDLGWAAYYNHGQAFVKRYIHYPDAPYPDNGMSYETYTNDFMLEMESLSPLCTVDPAESMEHEEIWMLVDGVEAPEDDDEAIAEAVQTLVKACSCCCEDDGAECCCGSHDDDCGCGCGDDSTESDCGCGCGGQ